ncbi:hypothetical protein EPUS_08731 [Endocarpon pusillum Z07020]|uniref:Solute carrier family 40 member n=1 Tax=Endocarpon pusillum (strain Z07020 / HMAS-L-300199) TaxID=1263415 RepID=U1GL13_ENDPU|nr:uncharacterized protein EPUS_08731 [Endocarpon pusillum Z07020]ERF72903.1 hypothetical protein EPUS_08731 [Endocarpon pusillum Z07020]
MSSSRFPTEEQSSELGHYAMDRVGDIELDQLLEDEGASTQEPERSASAISPPAKVVSGITLRLYISHFLSTWNSRVFEFGAVLFIAEIFPGTLLPVSVYAVVRAASAILLSSKVGRYIDVNDRLKVVRGSIGKSIKECSP